MHCWQYLSFNCTPDRTLVLVIQAVQLRQLIYSVLYNTNENETILLLPMAYLKSILHLITEVYCNSKQICSLQAGCIKFVLPLHTTYESKYLEVNPEFKICPTHLLLNWKFHGYSWWAKCIQLVLQYPGTEPINMFMSSVHSMIDRNQE